jgi:EAL and modified HD-GYP domain-containing signal transduction protein
MTEIFLGRQPIFDFEHRIVGYELLFRSGQDATAANVVDGDRATSEVIETAFMDIGLERIAGRYPVFINLTRNHLLKPPPLPPGQVVFEVLEDISFVKDVHQALRVLLKAGYRLALDDYVYKKEDDQILQNVHIVKLDVLNLSRAELTYQVERLRAYRVKLLAEKIESEDDYKYCRGLGFDMYQGFYFSRPKIVRGRRLKSNQLVVMKLLKEVYRKEVDFKKLEKLIGEDVTLSYKLLKMINSAYYSRGNKIESIRRALVIIGQSAISNWISMLALSSMDDKDNGLMEVSLARARMCELLAPDDEDINSDSYFTAGLFSVLDQLMKVPMDEVVRDLPLSDEVNDALMGREGLMGDALRCAISFEQVDKQLSHEYSDWSEQQLAAKYLEALDWVQETMSTLK